MDRRVLDWQIMNWRVMDWRVMDWRVTRFPHSSIHHGICLVAVPRDVSNNFVPYDIVRYIGRVGGEVEFLTRSFSESGGSSMIPGGSRRLRPYTVCLGVRLQRHLFCAIS